ncbi:hypothetical protein OKA04_04545 [Luteolibacter flavescens]|uniref:Uncharacterized protein n=1 Tax=Luteolibacter flavescens TaxID=1859460 RepID=A0ABT3FKB4_9BACT|nr:hypothetical protein [Luteolibacter flavescens]MCW1883985.1 hypothetical protein [Luteolibacter flavescens]
MDTLRDKFPASAGWLHVRLTRKHGPSFDRAQLAADYTREPGSEIGHLSVSGRRALVIYRTR